MARPLLVKGRTQVHSEKPFAAEIEKVMNELGIKGSLIKDSATQGPNGRDGASALAGLAGTFQELLSKAGIRLEDGFSALLNRTDANAVVDRPEPANHADDYGRDNADDRHERFENRDNFDNDARSNDTGEDRSDSHHADKDEDFGRQLSAFYQRCLEFNEPVLLGQRRGGEQAQSR